MSRQSEHEEKVSGRYEGKFASKKEKKQHRFPLGIRILFGVAITLVSVIVIAGAAGLILHEAGRKKMLLDPDTVVSFPTDVDEKDIIVQKDDEGKTISYHGHTYVLNENLATFLFMGIDETISDNPAVPGQAGQADVILLVAIDTETGKTKILCFPRDTYAEVDIYSTSGVYVRTDHTQLCLAYAYGDRLELSCQNMLTSVERFLYGLKINSYVALDMSGILTANDSIGGVTVKSLLDFRKQNGSYVKTGDEVTLLGKDAEQYIRSRSHENIDANVARMERQKQYVKAFVNTVIRQSKGDPLSLVSLYQLLEPYMVTDLGLDKATFLAPVALKTDGEFEFRTVQTDKIEMVDNYPMYFLNETDLQDAVVSVFYTQID